MSGWVCVIAGGAAYVAVVLAVGAWYHKLGEDWEQANADMFPEEDDAL